MSVTSRLDQELVEKFNLESRLHAPSPLHRRARATLRRQPGAPPLLVSWAQHPPLPPDAVTRQQDLAIRMQASSTPLLTAVSEHRFGPESHWMSAVLPQGQELRDILRVQQHLSVEQMEWLLDRLGEALRSAVDMGWPRLALDATQIIVDFTTNAMTVLMPDMPLFGLTVSAQTDATQTIAFNPAAFAGVDDDPVPGCTRGYVTPLAMLCVEMLGASAGGSEGQNERFRAIPALTIHQNTLLRSALAGTQRHSFETLDEFVTQFLGGGEVKAATGHAAAVSAPSGGAAESGGVYRTGSSGTSSTSARVSGGVTAAPITRKYHAPVDETLLQTMPAGYTRGHELRTRDNWRLHTALHPAFGEVLLTALDVTAEVGEAVRRLLAHMQKLQQSACPELLRPVDVRCDQRVLHVARPLPAGRTLLDALRERRSFPRPIVARLLASIHASYEALWALLDSRCMAASLDQFWLPHGGGEADGHGLLLDAPQIALESVGRSPGPSARPVGHFARLTLMLLGQGGSLTGEDNSRFTPVPELSVDINGLLRRAIAPDPPGDLTLPRLLAQLTAALAGHTAVAQASRHVLQVPEDLRASAPPPCTRLRLKPLENSQPVISLCADDSLWLGRASTHSDYVAHFVPHNHITKERTLRISRAQARLFMQNGQVFIQDIGTTNPSFTAGRRINGPEIADLPMTLVLAGEYPVEVRPLKSAYATPGPAVIGWPPVVRRSLRRGGCALFSLDSGTAPFEAAWLFTDASLAADNTGRLAFDDKDPHNSIARFHHHADAFWVEATAASMIDLNGRRLNPGDVAPLKPGDELRLLGQLFQVQACHLESVSAKSDA
jgi:hypothetical protein